MMRRLLSRLMEENNGEGNDLTGESIGSGNDARIKMLERINDQNDHLRAEDLADVNDAGLTEQFVPNPLEAETPEETVERDEQQAEYDNQAGYEPPKEEPPVAPIPAKYNLKVNGKEIPLTLEEIFARAQKVEAADTYLAEASRIRKEAEQQAQPPVPSQEDQDAAQLQKRRELVRAIQMGSEEEAMAAIAELQSRPSITQADLTRTVDERLTFKEAVGKFQTEYQDILKDPMLHKLALQKDQELLQSGDKRDYWTRYDEIGTDLRKWKESLAGTPPPPPVVDPVPTPTSVKQTRKAAVPPPPKVSNTKAPAPVAEDDQEESPQAVIAAMQKQRGGPAWMRS
jgi:hypothetical protein